MSFQMRPQATFERVPFAEYSWTTPFDPQYTIHFYFKYTELISQKNKYSGIFVFFHIMNSQMRFYSFYLSSWKGGGTSIVEVSVTFLLVL